MRHAILRGVDGGSFSGSGLLRRVGRAARVSLVGSILLLGGAATQARPVAALPDAPAVNENGGARPVAAWNGFCAKYPAECIVDTSQPAIIACGWSLLSGRVALDLAQMITG